LPYIRPKATEKDSVQFGRLSGMVVIVLGIVCTGLLALYSEKPIFIYLMNAYGYFTPGIATMFLLGILWKRTTHAGAISAGLLTVPLSLALEFAFPEMSFFNRTGIVFWSCMAVCALISFVTKPKTDAELTGLIWNKSSLSLRPEERVQQRGLRNPFIWWALITVVVLFFYVKFA